MVKARGPSKGANWIARERGMIRPHVHSSSSLFNQKGNPWLTREEQNRDYPLNRSSLGDQPETEFERKARDLRLRLAKALGKEFHDFKSPQPRIVVDPDLDRYQKAQPIEKRQRYVDPKGKPTTVDHARWRANFMMRVHRAVKGNVVNIQESIEKPEKIKGNFYDFSSPPMTDEKLRKLRVKRKGRK